MQNIWQSRVKKVVQNRISGNVLAAFNTNVDVVVHLTEADLAGLSTDPRIDPNVVRQLDGETVWEINTENEFLAVLRDALKEGKSHYIVLRNLGLLAWLESVFPTRQESMGGQAGIIANQMAALGANAIVYTALLSRKQGSLFFPNVKTPTINGALSIVEIKEGVRQQDHTKENWIFEYAKGERFVIDGQAIVTPRANRVILATRPEGAVMEFSPELAEKLPKLGRKIDVAFLAGFHYAPTDQKELQEYLQRSIRHVRELKKENPALKLHFEYVPMSEIEAERAMLRAVASEIQSFGINENEIKRVLRSLGFPKEAQAIEEDERAYSLYQGALRIMESLGFERVQLHNLGYYVVLLKKPYAQKIEQVRAASLYASAVNAIKAKYGGYVRYENLAEAGEIALSEIGLRELRGFGAEMKAKGYPIPTNFAREGICEMADHYALIIPAHVVPNPVSTVGMGDTISSSSFAYEWARRSVYLGNA